MLDETYLRLSPYKKKPHLRKTITHPLVTRDSGFGPSIPPGSMGLWVTLAPYLMLHYSGVQLSAPTPRGLF